jgi:hypothetical protein
MTTRLTLVHDARAHLPKPTRCPGWCDRYEHEPELGPHAEHWRLLNDKAARVDLATVEGDDAPHVQIEFKVPVRDSFMDLSLEDAKPLRDMLTEALRLARPLRVVRS